MVDVPLRHSDGKGRRQDPPKRRRSRWGRPLAVFAIVAVAIVVLGLIARTTIDVYRARLTLTGLTDDPTPVALTVAGESLLIPANMIRSADTRRGGDADRVDLALHWPTLAGYSDAFAAAFKDGSPDAPIVYATIAPRDTALDATARLDQVYSRYFVGGPLAAPAGLTGRRLSDDSGYTGEIVYFLPDGPRPFVARCPSESTTEMPATCLRDINFGENLSLLYRFNRDLLGEWRTLETGFHDLTERIRAAD